MYLKENEIKDTLFEGAELFFEKTGKIFFVKDKQIYVYDGSKEAWSEKYNFISEAKESMHPVAELIPAAKYRLATADDFVKLHLMECEDVSIFARGCDLTILGLNGKGEFTKNFHTLNELYEHIISGYQKGSLCAEEDKLSYRNSSYEAINIIKDGKTIIFSNGKKTDGIKHAGRRYLYFMEKLNNWKKEKYQFGE